jgi:hypothetical protein
MWLIALVFSLGTVSCGAAPPLEVAAYDAIGVAANDTLALRADADTSATTSGS